MNDFKKLTVWQEAMDLTVEIYQATAQFPASEKFSLPVNSTARPFPFHPTLPKGLDERLKVNFTNS